MRWLLTVLALLVFPASAQAAWMQASSPHFVIYADDSAASIQRFSQELERYHAAMAFITGTDLDVPSPSNRVTVYVVGGERQVRQLAGEGSQNVAGFYVPRAGGSIAIVPRVSNSGSSGSDLDFSKIVLLHEYAHHFLISARGFPMPRWYSEGAAEFFASAAFPANGGVGLGRPAQHRAAELYFARDVTAEKLIDPSTYTPPRGSSMDAFYGKSWLLYHYLVFEPSRRGQMLTYLRGMAAGKSSREAGIEAFGDLAVLERDLDRYLRRPRVMTFNIPPERLTVGASQVRALSPGEAAIMPVMVRSRRGVNQEQAAELVIEARAIAARFPGDAAVQAALAEAEYDSGHDAEAIAAANAALAIDPQQVNAYVQKGYAMFRQAEASSDPRAFRTARAPFMALNDIENDHPLPLIYFYMSFLRDGVTPTANAVQGLERAAALAPFDLGLRMMVARQQLLDGRRADARANLVPVAYNPHGGSLAQVAQEMIARLDADPNWNGADMLSVEPGQEGGEGS